MAQSEQPGNDRSLGAGASKQARVPLKDRSVTLTVSLPKAIFGGVFFLFVLVWAFIFGIMIGRGHNPEKVVPQLAKVMPAPTKAAPAPQPNDSVLQPRDLKYHESLKGKQAATPPRPAPIAPAPAAPQKPVPAQQAAAPKPAVTPAPPTKQPPAKAKAAPEDQTVYNYVYQAAASSDPKKAEELRQKLRRGGLAARTTTSVSNGTTWYRIMISFRGTPEDTRALRDKLASFGISHIILRGKEPVK